MLRRLFKGRHPLNHPDATVRRDAIVQLDDAGADALAGELARLLKEDPEPTVRLACLVRIRDPELLESVLNDPLLGEAAAQRLLALAPGCGSPDNQPDPGSDGLLALPLEQAVSRVPDLNDVEAVIDLALKARGELREAALRHPLLRHATALGRLEKRSRDRNKSVNRHARSRLDHHRHLSNEAESRRQRARELSAALGRTPPAVQDHAWRERQHQLHVRLEETLDHYRALRGELAEFGDTLEDLESLRSSIDDLPALEPAPASATATAEDAAREAEPRTAAADEPSGTAQDPFDALVAGFRELDEALTAGQAFAGIAAQRQALTDRWLTAADHRPPTPAQHQVFETVSHRYRELADAMDRLQSADRPAAPTTELQIGPPEDIAGHRTMWGAVGERRRLLKRLEQIDRQVRWPDWAPPTAEYAAFAAETESLRQELARADKVLDDELVRLDELVNALTAAIDEGAVKRAQGLLSQARALHDALPAAAVRGHAKGLGKQAARLAELKDWQTFATSPKRESLAQAMEALAAEPLDAQAQADRIKALRREWQALGPVTHGADGRLADRFNSAAERAFEPCRAHFAQQAEQRKANLAERRRICDQLERYLDDTDWAHADMKGAERIMRAAREEWRSFHPVDRNPGKAVEARFEQLQERLHDRVKAEWDRNLKAKEDIVAEAQALADDTSPIAAKVEQAKRLQHQWREVGITPRRPDQRLWRDFRNACDRIFSARDESRHAADAAIHALEERLSGLLDDFATTMASRDPGSVSDQELKSFRSGTADVDRLPPNRRRALSERRAALIAGYGKLLDEQRRAGRREALLALARWDEAMTAAELARQSGAELEWPAPPAGVERLREERLAAADQPVPVAAARRLAVKAELAAGLPSPAEDEPLRLEVQVERLQAGLSGGARDEEPRTLAEAWCRLGPKDDSLAPLRERLFGAVTALL